MTKRKHLENEGRCSKSPLCCQGQLGTRKRACLSVQLATTRKERFPSRTCDPLKLRCSGDDRGGSEMMTGISIFLQLALV